MSIPLGILLSSLMTTRSVKPLDTAWWTVFLMEALRRQTGSELGMMRESSFMKAIVRCKSQYFLN